MYNCINNKYRLGVIMEDLSNVTKIIGASLGINVFTFYMCSYVLF
jgi:hypothetical protein